MTTTLFSQTSPHLLASLPSDPPAPTASPAGGHAKPQILFGKYRLIRQLGRGGMGTVWLVEHLGLRCLRALKTIAAGLAVDPWACERFRREALAMAIVSAHPNVVQVHDADLTAEGAYIEMEFIPGHDLRELLKPGIPMPTAWVAKVVEQLCDALQFAHDNGVVHRDLKPSNLMLLDGGPLGQGHLKVVDFGLAKMLTQAGLTTVAGGFVGTPAYASPEQVLGHPVDSRSDIYSVGVMLYEFLTGYVPFNGPLQTLLANVVAGAPPPFAEVNSHAHSPPALEQLVMRCLAKDPADRPRSAAELAELFLAAGQF